MKLDRFRCLTALVLLVASPALLAFDTPRGDAVAAKAFSAPGVHVTTAHRPLSDFSDDTASQLQAQLSALGANPRLGYYDSRSGGWGTIVLTRPLVPGSGVGNALTWSSLGVAAPETDAEFKDALFQAFRTWVDANRLSLGMDSSQFGTPSVGSYENRRFARVYVPQSVNGVNVRSAFVAATVNNGNLVLLTTNNWAPATISTSPSVSSEKAKSVVTTHLSGLTVREWHKPELTVVPMASGDGLDHRLAWSIKAFVNGSLGSWEALVDASSGQLLAFQDLNQYLEARKVVGGIFPVSNDGQSPNGVPDGVEQTGYPMPYAFVFDGNGARLVTNSEGQLPIADGTIRTSLTGPFVTIIENCGNVNDSSTCQALDLLGSAGTDCTVPAGRSFGNTHASRTGFYEVNRIIDQAKSWLGKESVANLWANRSLPTRMNIPSSCNAFWTPLETNPPGSGSINFYRSSAICRNTGEIAAVFDHEWGHGLDTFDDSPLVSNPGEAYADMAAIIRLNTSCVGRGFIWNGTCGGNGDPCTECSGVREADWMKRASGRPHDLAWVRGENPNIPGRCGTAAPNPAGTNGPCGLGTHCEGSIVTEAMWDLLKRDLPCHTRGWEQGEGGSVGGGRCVGGDATMNENSALLLATRLFYLAGGGVSQGYQCNVTTAGCPGSSWYMQILAADDDDGSLENGTPHMVAIKAAFARHGLSCGTPAVTNSGCSGSPAPTSAPTVTATAGVQSATVTWTAVPGAAEYWVLRTDGVHGCNMGKTRVATIPAALPLTFSQTGLLEGHTYYYSVAAVGGTAGVVAQPACAGPISACASVTPTAPAGVAGAAAGVEKTSEPTMLSGDGDPFVDNCEKGRLTFNVNNAGNVPLTNVRITAVSASPSKTEVFSALPISVGNITGLCGMTGSTAPATIVFRADGLTHGGSLTFTVTIAANELSSPVTGTVTITGTESDLGLGNLVYDFESGTEGWTLVGGAFNRTAGAGAEGSLTYVKSSSFTDGTCDRIRSPKVRLSPTSTLSLHNQFITEPSTSANPLFYDRGNVGLYEPAAGVRTEIAPDEGRLYNATDHAMWTGCNKSLGWATSEESPVNTWAESGWSSAALRAAEFAGREVQLEVIYGTDPLASLEGFQFDQVRLNNILVPVPDANSDACPSTTTCFEESDATIAYSDGWHAVSDAAASGGSYRVSLGKSDDRFLSFDFDINELETGSLRYKYATSSKGGTADVYIDGQFVETISYLGLGGNAKNPDFSVPEKVYSLGPGRHRFELRRTRDAVYIDRLCVKSGGSNSSPATGPGATTSQETTIGPGQESQSTVTVPTGAASLSVAAVSDGGAPLRLIVLDPLGAVAGVSESGDGVAVFDTSVSRSGIYVIRVVNLSASPANVWVAATPTLKR